MNHKNEWHHQVVALANTNTISWRGIAEMVGKPRSTVSDFLRAYYESLKESSLDMNSSNTTGIVAQELKWAKNKVDSVVSIPKIHLVIPDSQVTPHISLDFLNWIGQYVVRKRPDVIVHLGDFADMESLSSYDKGKHSAEGKRVDADIKAAIKGMETLLAPLRKLQASQILKGEEVYNPRMVLCLGNHEFRINRHVDMNPELHGFLGIDSLKYKDFGWEVVDFLTPINIDGVNYCHYFPNVMTGKALTGTSQNMLKVIGESFTMGHRQLLDVSTRFLPTNGKQQWGIIAGAGYIHNEDYKGLQGNHHWRGVIVKHNVKEGSFDPLFVSMDWLRNEYELA